MLLVDRLDMFSLLSLKRFVSLVILSRFSSSLRCFGALVALCVNVYSVMGISLQVWRVRIGTFSQFGRLGYRSSHLSGLVLYGRVTPRLACIIAVLLIVGEVEVNRSPAKLDDVIRRLDEVMQELRDTRAQLSTKPYEYVRDLTAKLQAWEAMATSNSTRIDHLEQVHAALSTQFANFTGATASALYTNVPAISDIAHELDMRATRKANIVLSGFQPSPTLNDGELVTNLLRDELGIATMVITCKSFGKPTAAITGPSRVLLAALSSDADASAAVRAALKLRKSTNDHMRDHVLLNAALTSEQRKHDYELRTELKQRRAAGKLNLVIGNGKLHSKSTRPVIPVTSAAAATGGH